MVDILASYVSLLGSATPKEYPNNALIRILIRSMGLVYLDTFPPMDCMGNILNIFQVIQSE